MGGWGGGGFWDADVAPVSFELKTHNNYYYYPQCVFDFTRKSHISHYNNNNNNSHITIVNSDEHGSRKNSAQAFNRVIACDKNDFLEMF